MQTKLSENIKDLTNKNWVLPFMPLRSAKKHTDSSIIPDIEKNRFILGYERGKNHLNRSHYLTTMQ